MFNNSLIEIFTKRKTVQRYTQKVGRFDDVKCARVSKNDVNSVAIRNAGFPTNKSLFSKTPSYAYACTFVISVFENTNPSCTLCNLNNYQYNCVGHCGCEYLPIYVSSSRNKANAIDKQKFTAIISATPLVRYIGRFPGNSANNIARRMFRQRNFQNAMMHITIVSFLAELFITTRENL